MSDADTQKKRTRRRLRVSCVECTRRRQKCDREQPCGLCKARKVEHLCRWELEPFSRPAPNRPPTTQRAGSKATSPKAQAFPEVAGSPSGSSESQSPSVATPSITYAQGKAGLATVDLEVKEAAIALAQLSVARHNEYLGTGSAVCALHNLTNSEAPLPTDTSNPIPFDTSNDYNNTLSATFTKSLQDLVANFPDKSRCDSLIDGLFRIENWFHGLPEKQVICSYKGMWWAIQSDLTSIQRINFNWVALLFSMFALSPACNSEEESRKYYLQALTARRLAEDMLSASFLSPRDQSAGSHGTAYGCLAASLLAKYLCDRGQMTEAWKLIGSALRAAQNSGLHLNPYWNRWKGMTKEEQALRSIAFHSLAFLDRFLSFCLGRPVMARHRDFDVPFCSQRIKNLEPDGSSNVTGIFKRCLFELMCHAGEQKDKFLSVHPDKGDGAASFEVAMSTWEACVPPYLAVKNTDYFYDKAYPFLPIQRGMLHVYYYACCMLFYRSLPCAQITSKTKPEDTCKRWDLEKLTSNAISLLNLQKEHVSFKTLCRQVCYSFSHLTFEGAVTLSICILRDPSNDAVEEWCRIRDESIEILQSVSARDHGNLVKQSVLLLRVLQDQRPRREPSTDSPSVGDAQTQEHGTQVNGDGISLQALDPQLVMVSNTFISDMSKSMDFSLGDRLPSGMDGSFSAFDFLFGSDGSQQVLF